MADVDILALIRAAGPVAPLAALLWLSRNHMEVTVVFGGRPADRRKSAPSATTLHTSGAARPGGERPESIARGRVNR